MQSYASVSGGVIFVPEKIDRKTRTASYSEFIEEETKPSMFRPLSFGKRKIKNKQLVTQVA
ncbi:MAG: hypothetical protein CBB87_06260 [Micavibrio sp. TMED27]|nr:hypothetical protein [Micavibrio sp.]OUT91613.1 MAG: hypothetical protein CBB87_06260 [Micavibrio sp. TMED27]|tara:strand:+ start:493 stop:675 length:183 start_codon:yes stop_codon:yes gene_type:complete